MVTARTTLNPCFSRLVGFSCNRIGIEIADCSGVDFDIRTPGACLSAVPVWICDGDGIEPVYNVSQETASRVRNVCRQGGPAFQVEESESSAAMLRYEAQASYQGQSQGHGQPVEACSLDSMPGAGVWQTASWNSSAQALPLITLQSPAYRADLRRRLQRQSTF